jgi:hypothetical protein
MPDIPAPMIAKRGLLFACMGVSFMREGLSEGSTNA